VVQLNNGNWRTWLLGIVATLAVTLIGNGIVFQRDTKEQLATLHERVKRNEERSANILKYLEQRIDEHFQRIDKRLERLEQMK